MQAKIYQQLILPKKNEEVSNLTQIEAKLCNSTAGWQP